MLVASPQILKENRLYRDRDIENRDAKLEDNLVIKWENNSINVKPDYNLHFWNAHALPLDTKHDKTSFFGVGTSHFFRHRYYIISDAS